MSAATCADCLRLATDLERLRTHHLRNGAVVHREKLAYLERAGEYHDRAQRAEVRALAAERECERLRMQVEALRAGLARREYLRERLRAAGLTP